MGIAKRGKLYKQRDQPKKALENPLKELLGEGHTRKRKIIL
jgi:hypothetical protein